MTNECVIANQEQEHGQSPEEDELALLRHQQALRRQLRGGGPVVFTFSSSHGPQIFHGRHRTALAWEACNICFYICICGTLDASPLDPPDRLPALHAGDSMGGMMEAADGMGIDLVNLQLGLMDRDFDESDYEVSHKMHAP